MKTIKKIKNFFMKRFYTECLFDAKARIANGEITSKLPVRFFSFKVYQLSK